MGFILSGEFAEPTARFLVVLYFAIFAAIIATRKALETTSCINRIFNKLPEKRKVNVTSHIVTFWIEICGLCLLLPNMRLLLTNDYDDSKANTPLMCTFTLLFAAYSSLMVYRAPYAPNALILHHYLVVACVLVYFALVSVHRQPVTQVAVILVMETMAQQLGHLAWVLHAFRIRVCFPLLMIDALWQLVLKTSTKIIACFFWWGTWRDYGDGWSWIWAVALPVLQLLLYVLQLYGNVWLQYSIGQARMFPKEH